jgi:hypothetical protein
LRLTTSNSQLPTPEKQTPKKLHGLAPWELGVWELGVDSVRT